MKRPQKAPDVMAEAKADRKWTIALLRACTCAYPVRVFRNGSGHAPECPAHRLWKEAAR